MNGPYWKFCKTLGTRGYFSHKGQIKAILRIPFAESRSVHSSSFLPYNGDYLIYQTSDVVCNKENTSTWVVPTLVRSVINGCDGETSQSNGNLLVKHWLRNSKNNLNNSIELYASSSDANKSQEQALKKLNEAQEELQQKLQKVRGELKTAADHSEKRVLEIMIKSTEESIVQLLDLRKKMQDELKKKK